MGYPIRQAYLSKLGFKQHDTETLGRFKTGTLVHEFFENEIGERNDSLEFETPVSIEDRGIQWVGHVDCIDRENGVIYDFKTRAGWYNFNPPVQRHLDQLYIYMKALDMGKAQVVYVSKKTMEVRTYPEDGVFTFDTARYEELHEKAQKIKTAIVENGIPTNEADIPFEKSDHWLAKKESLKPWLTQNEDE